MKGLQQYIKKHGFHFTVDLALKAGGNKWDEKYVLEKTQHRVYYNVIGATLGDMVFLVNNESLRHHNIRNSVNYVLSVVEDYSFCSGKVFMDWLDGIIVSGTEFDFTEYI